MSRHHFDGMMAGKPVSVTMGYDRPLDYVFCTVADDDGIIIYSNLDDDGAGLDQQSVDYYREVLREMEVAVPESMFVEVAKDQLRRVGNRTMRHQQPYGACE